MIDIQYSIGGLAAAVDDRLRMWASEGVIERLWSRDPALWSGSADTPELADRLGWLTAPEDSTAAAAEAASLRSALPFWITDLVLLGMGGSSLAPEVLARTQAGDGLPLTLLDSTHPAAVRQLDWVSPANTLFIVASKSGTTLETLSLFRHFWSRAQEAVDDPGSHFIAISDPGSRLVGLARERSFRAVFEASADVGGRFSALTAFGLVPAALMGADVPGLRAEAADAAELCREDAPDNPGAHLGAALAEAALAGRDKLTFVTTPEWAAFPDWAEQLIAESTGKDGRGIIPIAHEPWYEPDRYGADRLFVAIIPSRQALEEASEWGELDETPERLDALEAAGHPVVRLRVDRPEDIGALFFVWEVAVSLAGAALGIHPFNQPDVELAKVLAREAMEGGGGHDAASRDAELDLAWDVPPYGHAGAGAQPDVDAGALLARLEAWLRLVEPGDYVGIQAYLAGGDEDELEGLQAIRAAITEATGAATTLGYGPRFLHSTGQLHKGGPDNGVFLQLVDEAGPHVHVPETDFTFHQLVSAQALGDLGALHARERRVLRVRVPHDERGPSRLLQLLEQSSQER